jgi:hypothetical protein
MGRAAAHRRLISACGSGSHRSGDWCGNRRRPYHQNGPLPASQPPWGPTLAPSPQAWFRRVPGGRKLLSQETTRPPRSTVSWIISPVPGADLIVGSIEAPAAVQPCADFSDVTTHVATGALRRARGHGREWPDRVAHGLRRTRRRKWRASRPVADQASGNSSRDQFPS